MEDTLLPLQYPIKDLKTGQDVYEVFVQKGTAVYVGLSSTNRSTTIWGPDATEFKPERWIGRQAHESTVEQVSEGARVGYLVAFFFVRVYACALPNDKLSTKSRPCP